MENEVTKVKKEAADIINEAKKSKNNAAKNNATKKCKYCQSDIPQKATVCPVCRRKQKGISLTTILMTLILLAVLILLSGRIYNMIQENWQKYVQAPTEDASEKGEEEEYKESCEEYAYKDVLRNIDQYVGNKVKITVRLSSVYTKSNDIKYYGAYSKSEYGWYGDEYIIFDCRASQDLKLLEDDIITVYGEIVDIQKESSVIASREDTFCIKMKYIDFISE